MADEKADRGILFLELNGAEYGMEKSVRHYSSNHQMLLVGEGDFSFSLSLAKSFGFASNVCASSLDSYDDAVRKYKNARSNLETLKKLGASLLHGVDATDMHLHPCLKTRRFDRIVFNFPHAGFHGKESDSNLIRKHRKLVGGFFSCASRMLREDGEVHVSHKNKAPFCNWNLEELASRSCLVMTERVEFKKEHYPGYQNKRGAGSRCDEPFILGMCSTFRFRFSSVAKEIYAEKMKSRNLGCKKSKKSRRTLTPEMNDQPEVSSRLEMNGQRTVSSCLAYRLESLLDQVRQRHYPSDIRNKPSNDIQMQYQGVPDGIRQRPVSDLGSHQSMTHHMQFENASAVARQMPVLSSSVMLCREKRTQANEDRDVYSARNRLPPRDFPLEPSLNRREEELYGRGYVHGLGTRGLEGRPYEQLDSFHNRPSSFPVIPNSRTRGHQMYNGVLPRTSTSDRYCSLERFNVENHRRIKAGFASPPRRRRRRRRRHSFHQERPMWGKRSK